MKTQSWNDVKKELLKDPEFKKYHDEHRAEREFFYKIVEMRVKKKISQKQFAQLLKTTQPAVSRLENGKISPTIRFLSRVAAVFGKKLVVSFE